MTAVQIIPIAIAVIGLLAVCTALRKVRRPVLRALASAGCGAAALGAVNLFAGYTGVGIALNYATAFVTVVLGAPGVITMLFLRVMMIL